MERSVLELHRRTSWFSLTLGHPISGCHPSIARVKHAVSILAHSFKNKKYAICGNAFLSFLPIMMLFKPGFVVDSKVNPSLSRSHFYHQATTHYLIPVSLLLIPAMDKLLVYSMEVVVSLGSLAMIL